MDITRSWNSSLILLYSFSKSSTIIDKGCDDLVTLSIVVIQDTLLLGKAYVSLMNDAWQEGLKPSADHVCKKLIHCRKEGL